MTHTQKFCASIFLSTLSLRRATAYVHIRREYDGHFYPRSPCGERPVTFPIWVVLQKFLSTLSLRRATRCFNALLSLLEFLSTLSLRRATSTRIDMANSFGDFYPRSPCGERRVFNLFANPGSTISIHALLAESDWDLMGGSSCDAYFYPRSPCGERLVHALELANAVLFLSTLSLRRATR